jgi:hypothetical protein
MADILLDTQGTPATPAAGKVDVYPDSSTKQLTYRNENGQSFSMGGEIRNQNTADVVANGADTYLTGSMISVPQHLLQVGTTIRWRFVMTKSAAGVAAPVWSVRVGTAGTVADVARLTFTSPSAQTAAIDAGFVDVVVVLRNTGAAGVLAGGLTLQHNGNTVGLASIPCVVLQVTSAGFDTTVASLKIGVSVNPGASGVWTHQVVTAEAINL